MSSMMDTHVDTMEDLLRGIEGDHKSDKARCEADLEEADATLQQMKMEIHSVPAKAKDAYNAKIKSFQTRIAAGKKALLFTGSASAAVGSSSSAALAARQQTQEQKQQASLDLLLKTRQQLHETEAVGVDTVNRLATQIDQTKKITTNMVEVNSALNHANKTVNKMSHWSRG